jgi:predicted nuclease with TOPRIM domain
MSDIYEANAPSEFPAPQEQPEIKEDPQEGEGLKHPPVKETVDRWKREVLDKIQYLKENLEQAHLEKEALVQEMEQVKAELSHSRERSQILEKELAEALDTFSALLEEVRQALES